MSVVMNRLVVNEEFSLKQYYKELRKEISHGNESEELRDMYFKNLKKAYEKVTNSIYGLDEESEII